LTTDRTNQSQQRVPRKPRPAAHRKRFDANQQQGSSGQEMVAAKLPSHWVKRSITPDFGLDLHIEVFDQVEGSPQDAETRGEHFYIQAKSVARAEVMKLKVRSRRNVAKYRADPTSGDRFEIPVIAFDLEVGELMTVEAMGNAVPALLCVADMSSKTVYYLCLNDYISKVLLPNKPQYTNQQSVTVHIPSWNVLDSLHSSFAYIQLLARRPKLYSAFNTFIYQKVEFDHATEDSVSVLIDPETRQAQIAPEIVSMLDLFLSSNLRLDVFETAGAVHWAPLQDLGERFADLQGRLPRVKELTDQETVSAFIEDVETTMFRAANVGRMYEELVREWRLPTALAAMMDDGPNLEHRPQLVALQPSSGHTARTKPE